MLTLLTFGTLWFWLVSAIVFLVVVALVENEKEIFAGFLLIGTIAAFYFLGNHGILTWALSNPLHLLYYALGYFGAACCWGIAKWTLFVHNQNDKYQEAKARFLKDNKATELTAKLKKQWTEHVEEGYYPKNSYSYDRIDFIYPAPEARDHKSRIVAWMTYWPWSAFWTILNDPVRKAMRFIYNRISGVLNKISKFAYRNTSNDVLSKDELTKARLDEI